MTDTELWCVHARYRDPEPDTGGWVSHGRDLPTFYLTGIPADVLAHAHTIARQDRGAVYTYVTATHTGTGETISQDRDHTGAIVAEFASHTPREA